MASAARGDFIEELRWRGLLYQRTAEEVLDEHLATPGRVGYCGFDPTQNSLTTGNLVALRLLALWQEAGHRPIALMGGGTGLIGDPSGRDSERPLLSAEEVEANVRGQRRILERVLDFDPKRANAARVVNNVDWLGKLGFLEVLREVGKHFSVNTMIQRDSVRLRLEDRSQGISFTEFSYQLLQAYDFLHLHREHGCSLQMCGSDQYGNVVAGIDLIHRTLGAGAEAFGVSAPLITRSDGKKISKSEGSAVWLTADRTSPYAFYQHWINVPDADVAPYLNIFTRLGRDEIEAILAEHGKAPERRVAQQTLAAHMTEMLHGGEECRHAEAASEAVFGGGDLQALGAATLAQVVADLPHSEGSPGQLGGDGLSLVELLPDTTLAKSKREAREFLKNGAIWVNGERAVEPFMVGETDLLPGGTLLLRRGKKRWHAVSWG